ncbi:MAG: AEC family transporter, partial [Gammaproteobacteria bacterium]
MAESLFTRIAGIVLPIILIVAVGWFYGRARRPPMDAANIINMDVFLPALVFSALSSRAFDPGAYKLLVLGGLAVVLGSGLA